MLIDARQLPTDTEITAQVCIVGSGPAGMALAMEFMQTSIDVCIVESGGVEFDQGIQNLSEGKVVGSKYPSLETTRRRQLGGTSHSWEAPVASKQPGFRCMTLDEIDFEKRSWIPYSGWPFKKCDLDPYYQRAFTLCKISNYSSNIGDWESESAASLPFHSNRITSLVSHYSSRYPFTDEYPNLLGKSNNIRLLLHANVTNIELDDSLNQVSRIQITRLDGTSIHIRSRVFVLATGGIENARLLLTSNKQKSSGVGNSFDLVGRYFMDRPVINVGYLKLTSRAWLNKTKLYDISNRHDATIMSCVMLSPETIRQERLVNSGCQLFPKPLPRQTRATKAFRDLSSLLIYRKKATRIYASFLDVLKGSDYITAAIFWNLVRRMIGFQGGEWSYLPIEKNRFSRIQLVHQIEQVPDPENRIVLDSTVDALGIPQPKLIWSMKNIDIQNAMKAHQILKTEFEKANIGVLEFELNEDGSFLFYKTAMAHHMGTTRMNENPRYGVVDSNCCLHDVYNLFVAGSSTFPTAGYANPTLTIIALSIRLADHIKARL